MICGIGIDLVSISRFRDWMKHPRLLQRYFHPLELQTALQQGDRAVQACAARFAVKEAFGKALGTGIRGFSLQEVEMRNSSLGKPEIWLHNRARECLRRVSGKQVHLSLSHEQDQTVAMVVIEG